MLSPLALVQCFLCFLPALSLADLPAPRSKACTVVVDDVAYMIGGGSNGFYFNEAWRYNLTKGLSITNPRWHAFQPIGKPYGFQACAASPKNIIVFGGYANGTKPTNDLYFYNIQKRYWKNLTSVQQNPPPVRARAVGIYANGRFTTTLGREGPQKAPVWNTDLFQLSLNNLNWTLRLDTYNPPEPRDSYTLTMLDERHGVLLGGLTETGMINMSTIGILNIGNRKWKYSVAVGDVPPSMGGQNAIALNSTHILVYGGLREDNWDNNLWILDMTRYYKPVWSVQNTTIVGAGQAPPRLINAVTVMYEEFVMIAFGSTDNSFGPPAMNLTRHNDHYILNTNTWSWVASSDPRDQ